MAFGISQFHKIVEGSQSNEALLQCSKVFPRIKSHFLKSSSVATVKSSSSRNNSMNFNTSLYRNAYHEISRLVVMCRYSVCPVWAVNPEDPVGQLGPLQQTIFSLNVT